MSAGAGRTVAWLALAVVAVLYPLVVPGFWAYQIGAQSLLFGMIALSLNLLAGYGGMVSLAQMAIAGAAGYATAYFGVNSTDLGIVLPWPLTVVTAICLGTLFGAVVGAISVRTRGIYCLMITLAIAVGFSLFARQNYSVFNGFNGFAGVRAPTVAGIDFNESVPFYYLTLAVAALALGWLYHVVRTPFGIALQGIRDNPRRMRTLGFDVIRLRIAAFALSGLIAATGGVLFVWYNGRISPGAIDVQPTIDILIISVVGGMASPLGAFVGAVAFVLLQNFAIDLISPDRFNTLIGLAFLVVVLFSPEGLTGIAQRLLRGVRGAARAERPPGDHETSTEEAAARRIS
ncbi:hypothetical protein KBTX_03743 [wastewater metagenome]|uniref:Branched-chain amino acid transport system / permease component n=2 Tax=unclassified sequences TaxID=12908 RepID=A0A5B8RHD4_9ZZZZ|nr:branched-chain amino acid ABC transporter permease [Arhodomonas sp. KWT]QEA07393.1 hypothetical protein KBTEX_03743 [uncultured organism]